MAAEEIDTGRLAAWIGSIPALMRIRNAAAGTPAYLVGGAVRDLLRGHERTDLDVVLEGDAIALARRLDADATTHERFGTAAVTIDGLTVDLARARAESYPAPGALPQVRPGTIAEDLARRDFTINAMAVPLVGEASLIDPHGGAGDLDARLLRVLHPSSFADDPTRALRAARYSARLGLSLEPETAQLLRSADLQTVSGDRVEAELRLLASEADVAAPLGLIRDWGLLDLDEERIGLVARAIELLEAEPWAGTSTPGDAVVAIARGDLARASELAAGSPAGPSEVVATAHGHDATTLLAARAMGAGWLDEYVSEWRHVRLEIGGHDLLAAGVPEGPAIGRGLQAALRAKLDGEAVGRDAELEVALAAAGGA